MLGQALHLCQPGAGGNQHQRALGQAGQAAIPQRRLDPHHALLADMLHQRSGARIAGQDMQLQYSLLMGGGGDGEGRQLAVGTLQQQVLTGLVAQRLACRGAQQDATDIAAQVLDLDQLAGQAAQRQFVRGQYPFPQHFAVFQWLGNAGVEFTTAAFGTILHDPAADQVGGADMAVAIAAALRCIKAQAAHCINDPLAGQQLDHMPGRLQGDFHQSIPSSAQIASTRCCTAGSWAMATPHSRLVSPGHLLVASSPILLPRPDTGEAKSR